MKAALLSLALSLASAYAQKPFALVEAWEASVAAGDEFALAKLYTPDAATQAGTRSARPGIVSSGLCSRAASGC